MDHVLFQHPDDRCRDFLAGTAPALAARAPVDLRVNRLRASREAVAKDLAHLQPEEGAWSPDALRFQPGQDGRGPSLQTEALFFAGAFEIQDEGSQLVTLLAGVKPGETVIDLCAGAGGKTLALAALMANRGNLYATDLDGRRLAPLHDRLARSGADIVDIRIPRSRASTGSTPCTRMGASMTFSIAERWLKRLKC